ncbi:MAG: beta strand repeat-containing protein, partial [Waterburya sp.]
SLDVEGSFFGTTADSVIFKNNTEFSATQPQSPLLTIGVPLGLQIGTNPGSIVVRSPLALPNGQNLSFVGGNLEFQGSGTTKVNGVNDPEDIITAPGGKVELGGLSTDGIIGIEQNGNLSFPEAITRADVTFNNLTIDVSAGGGGSIMVNARNLELFDSDLEAGINPSVELASGQAGDITINATDKVLLNSSNDGSSTISNVTGDISELTELTEAEIINTQGNAGNIQIQTESLEAKGSFSIGSLTNGEGNAGNVSITASESINLLPTAEITSENGGSGIYSYVEAEGTGNGANIGINTPVLALSKSLLFTTTIGAGDAGDITVNAADSVSINQRSQLQAGTVSSGDAGNVTIAAPQADIFIDGQGTIVTTVVSPPQEINSPDSPGSVVGTGKGGDITIQGRNFFTTNGAVVSTLTGGEVTAEGLANAGNLKLDIADSMTISNNSVLSTNTTGEGNAGNLELDIAGFITISDNSGLSTNTTGKGNAGNLTIDTNQLNVKNSVVNASSSGSGQAGNLKINADESIDISGTLTSGEDIIPAGLATSSTKGNTSAGNLTINTQKLAINEGAAIQAITSSAGDGGTINISTNKLVIRDNSGIGVLSQGDGNAGKIFAQVRDSLEIENGTISSLSDRSSGGEISISAGSIRLQENSDI